jgi:hypothetical protein
MFGWGKKKRSEELLLQIVRAAAEGERAGKLRRNLATLDPQLGNEKDVDSLVPRAACKLMKLITGQESGSLSSSSAFVDSIFLMVISNHISYVLQGDFEKTSLIAILDFFFDPSDKNSEVGVLASEAIDGYNAMARQQSKVISAIGNQVINWCNEPTDRNLARLKELYQLIAERE